MPTIRIYLKWYIKNLIKFNYSWIKKGFTKEHKFLWLILWIIIGSNMYLYFKYQYISYLIIFILTLYFMTHLRDYESGYHMEDYRKKYMEKIKDEKTK